jgi:hypothetical protein
MIKNTIRGLLAEMPRSLNKAVKHLKAKPSVMVNFDGVNLLEVNLLKSMVGRTWESPEAHKFGVNYQKTEKFITNPLPKREFTMNLYGWLATIMHIGGRTATNKSKKAWLEAGLALLDSDGKIDIHDYMSKNSTLKIEEEVEITRLIKGWNSESMEDIRDMLLVSDAKAQNWSIYAMFFYRGRSFMSKLNAHIGSVKNPYEIDTFDFNTENQVTLIALFKSLGASKQILKAVTRDVPKFIAMLLGYGAGWKTVVAKVLSETGDSNLADFVSGQEEAIMEWINSIVPEFETYLRELKALAADVEKDIYSFGILGVGYAMSNPSKVTTEEDGFYTVDYTHEAKYQLFKVAFTTHAIDAWLVHAVRGVMQRDYGVDISTNHDSFAVHPQFMFELLDSYIIALKTLFSAYKGKILGHLSTMWGAEKPLKLRCEDEVSIEEFVRTPNAYFINHIWNM